MSDLQQWLGRKVSSHDVITASNVKRFNSTIGISNSDDESLNNGDAVPLGFHWCLCLPDNPMAELGIDGHPNKGGFLPPVPLPRRMWAASEVEFLADLTVGAEVTRESTIASVKEKTGKTGALVFVDVDHQTFCENECAIKETQTIVYREATTKQTPLPDTGAGKPACWQAVSEILPTQHMLFRYSALTFNSHRIHYDLPYAQTQEMYPELVVHAPLIATHILQLAAAHQAVSKFSFRAMSAAFCNQTLTLAANFNDGAGELAAIGADGRECLTAKVNS